MSICEPTVIHHSSVLCPLKSPLQLGFAPQTCQDPDLAHGLYTLRTSLNERLKTLDAITFHSFKGTLNIFIVVFMLFKNDLSNNCLFWHHYDVFFYCTHILFTVQNV